MLALKTNSDDGSIRADEHGEISAGAVEAGYVGYIHYEVLLPMENLINCKALQEDGIVILIIVKSLCPNMFPNVLNKPSFSTV